MWHETTDPDIVNQFAATSVAPADLQKQIAVALERVRKHPLRKALREPRMYWEEPGLHGEKREANLRPAPSSAVNKLAQRRLSREELSPLPPHHVRRFSTQEKMLAAGAIVGVSAFAWWMWKRRKPNIGFAVPKTVMPDWAMT